MGGESSTNGEKRNAYQCFVGQPDGKRPLGRTRCKSVDDSNKMDHGDIGWGGVNWIGLA
jgi:hypothetical protein